MLVCICVNVKIFSTRNLTLGADFNLSAEPQFSHFSNCNVVFSSRNRLVVRAKIYKRTSCTINIIQWLLFKELQERKIKGKGSFDFKFAMY